MRFLFSRREPSERSNRGNSSSRPVTSGARTRRASSSSSCPVSSPSSTTIVLASTASDTSGGHAEEGGIQTRGLARALPLRRRKRQSHHGRGEARADRVARDSASLEGGLDRR